MTPRAWLLAMAAALAGVIAALTWPDAPGPRRIAVQERQLLSIDLEAFEKVCAQMERDRADFERGAGGADIPSGLGMGQFAQAISNAPARLEGTCERAGVSLSEFLEILSAMEKARRATEELQRWNDSFEERANAADAVAGALERLGQTPPPPVSTETKPPWYDQLTPAVRDSLPAWTEIRATAAATWAKAMKLQPAGAADDAPAGG